MNSFMFYPVGRRLCSMLYLWIERGVWEAFCVCCSPIHRKREVLLFIIFFFLI